MKKSLLLTLCVMAVCSVVHMNAYADDKNVHMQEDTKACADGTACEQSKKKVEQPLKKADSELISKIIGDETTHVLGNPSGSFVIIEFFDYNCGYCKKMNKKMAEAIKKSDNIRWILVDTPIFGEKSEVIARYTYAAAKQGKFAEFHTALGEASDKTPAGLNAIGEKLGLNVDQLAKDASSDEAKEKVSRMREYSAKLGMNGVPMFIVDGFIQTGAFSDEQMEEYIRQAEAMKPAKSEK